MTFQHHDGSCAVARLPNRLSPEAEFLMLMELRQNTSERLERLAHEMKCEMRLATLNAQEEFDLLMERTRRNIERAAELMDVLGVPAEPAELPRSGLKQAAPGLLLFKGGRDAS